ncbi:hypothetical protein [uncultured Mucilaginibacter sp.]|uniref:hypothetical protein n=1 Tax=uncultured Mucilaginibacter sp. TaxID=797541 RepID=UPI0025DA25DD|nr:hypothetical protein [uncultured Mucilaginibacter sp.]
MNKNTKIVDASFNPHFCDVLEYHLTECEAFDDFSTKFERFWCDGVSMPEYDSELLLQNVINTKQIRTRAWMMLGQKVLGIYQMTIKLGKQSVENCVNRLPLIDCLPDTSDLHWVTLNMDEKAIIIQLK